MRHKGYLDGFELSRKDAEDMILSARVLLGWIEPEAPAAAEGEEEADEAGNAGDEPASQA